MLKNKYQLGGWLLLLFIILVLSLLGTLNNFLLDLIFGLVTFDIIIDGWYFSLVIVYSYLLYLMIQNKKSFPKWCIFTLWYGFFTGFFLQISFKFLDIYTPHLLIGIFSPIVWTIYLLKSERVKETFK